MEVFIVNEQEPIKVTEEIQNIITSVIEKSLQWEDFNEDVEVSVTIVDNTEIKKINLEFRDKDAVTDVLSFPMLNFESGYVFNVKGEHRTRPIYEDEGLCEGELFPLGDIVISFERAKEQAIEYGHSFEREVAFLTCHSMLHLMGYDHMNEEDEKIMFNKQDLILKELGYTR